jgi:hypothetical protein
MAVYKTVSVNEVIARVLRNTRLQDASYIDDIIEWISEAMFQMKSEHVLVPKKLKLTVEFHYASLPSDLDSIECIAYNGKRLFEGGPGLTTTPTSNSTEVYKTVVGSYAPGGSLDTGEDIETVKLYPDPQSFLVAVDANNATSPEWYRRTAKGLEFSIEDGEVYLYYWAYELDCDGYLLIPDVDEFKEAIYWYVRMKLIESGWQDPVMQYRDVMFKWEQLGPRGANAVAQSTPDEEARMTRNLIRLITPDNWKSGFAINGPEKYL